MSAGSTSPPDPAELSRGSLIPALPDDLAIHCIALLPRAAHPSLALVSRAFHALPPPGSRSPSSPRAAASDYLGQVKGCDPATDSRSTVEGLERELPRFLCGATLANVRGLLYLVWEGKRNGKEKGDREARSMMVIDWAGIDTMKVEAAQLRGKVVSRDTVLFPNVPRGSTITHCIALEQ